MYKKISEMATPHQIIFSVIIAFAVISFWRGVWGLMDLYVFPDNLKVSFVISLITGLILLVITNYATKEFL